MQGLLSFKLWLIITGKLFNAIFPTVFVLMLFSWKELGNAWKKPSFRLLVVFAACELGSRLFIFFMGMLFQGRYLYSLSILACILAGAGFFRLAEFAGPYLKKIRLPISAAALILIVVFAVNAGKGLYSVNDKKYLQIIPELVKMNCPPGARPVIVTELNDVRMGYYAKAEVMILTFAGRPDKNVSVKKGWYIWKPESRPVEKKALPAAKSEEIGDLCQALSRFGGENLFVIVRMEDQEFKDMFAAGGAEFNLKHLKTFKDDKRKPISAYQAVRKQ
ncbi:MAG TPA: hypothetical protein DET40_19135 [Lentisphaeria bacterium]|nr:MAG: hypothetical protein A2X45_25230 [Lentisphaerae bacterium GWF2_50_93]HCE45662.1 hypothetical protein [Lentisphaeria bacterium]